MCPNMDWDSEESSSDIPVKKEVSAQTRQAPTSISNNVERKVEQATTQHEVKETTEPRAVDMPATVEVQDQSNPDDKSFLVALAKDLPQSTLDFLQAEKRTSTQLSLESLVELKRLLPPDRLVQLVSEFFKIPLATNFTPDREVLKKHIVFFMAKNILPLSPTEFVIATPRLGTVIRRDLAKEGFQQVRFYVARKGIIAKALRTAILSMRDKPQAVQDRIQEHIGRGQFTKAVTEIISYAFRLYSSDLHFERRDTHGVIRARVDGILEDICPLSADQYDRTVGAIYRLAETQQPSARESADGAFQVDGFPLQVRVSFFPSLHGTHNVVMRLLPASTDVPSGEDLGYSTDEWAGILKAVQKSSSGLVLLVGPTGSGKNSTIFSLLSSLDTRGKKLIEVADPIEYQHMLGIQAQLVETEKLQWRYADALRAALRHDPDMIAVGEIRDEESAKIALDAARTGHLIFSTVHAETAFEAFDRLADLGCKIPYLLSAVKLVVAQRLLRKLCQNCFGDGCQKCVGGFTGRFAIAEVLTVTDALREEFNGQLPVTPKKRADAARLHCPGYRTLLEAALQAEKDKLTTRSEIERVLGQMDRRRPV